MANTTPKPTGEMAGDAPIVTAGDPANDTPAPAGTVIGGDGGEHDLDGRRPPMKDLKGIRYSGMADHRVLTAEDLERIGVPKDQVQTELVWNKDNDFLVPITDVNAATLDAVIALPGFTAV